MQQNPQTPRIILFHSKEVKVQANKQYLVITDKGGEQHKISEKRQPLWGIFNEARDAEPFMLVYEIYNNQQYVANAQPITEGLLKVAIQDMGIRLSNQQTEERNRSTSLSYAKDLVVGDKAEIADIYDRAQWNYEFIKGEMPREFPSEEEETG